MIQNDASEMLACRMARFVRENGVFSAMLVLSVAMLGSIPIVIDVLAHSRASSSFVSQMTPGTALNRLRFEKCMSAMAVTDKRSPSIDDVKLCRSASGSAPVGVIDRGGDSTNAAITVTMSGAAVD